MVCHLRGSENTAYLFYTILPLSLEEFVLLVHLDVPKQTKGSSVSHQDLHQRFSKCLDSHRLSGILQFLSSCPSLRGRPYKGRERVKISVGGLSTLSLPSRASRARFFPFPSSSDPCQRGCSLAPRHASQHFVTQMLSNYANDQSQLFTFGTLQRLRALFSHFLLFEMFSEE